MTTNTLLYVEHTEDGGEKVRYTLARKPGSGQRRRWMLTAMSPKVMHKTLAAMAPPRKAAVVAYLANVAMHSPDDCIAALAEMSPDDQGCGSFHL